MLVQEKPYKETKTNNKMNKVGRSLLIPKSSFVLFVVHPFKNNT